MDRITSFFLTILVFNSAMARRTHLFPGNTKPRSPFTSPDGICSSMIESRNYPCTEHKVTTKDGYILSLQNIPYGRSGEKSGEKQPVLLQHGLLTDAIIWLLSPPDQSLALVLADNGFDVWLVSTRGTKYSLGHTSLKPDDYEVKHPVDPNVAGSHLSMWWSLIGQPDVSPPPVFWDWSWDELAAYDLPATFEYVYEQTGQKLHYVGHSLGSLLGLAAFSEGQLVNMLRSAAMLCPIAYLGQVTSPLARTAAQSLLAETLYWLDIHEFSPRGEAVVKLLSHMCQQKGVDCTHLLISFTGKNCCLNSSIVGVFLEHEPQSTSTKNMIHIAQMIREGRIKKYDYGDEKENMKHYGLPTPPSYNMSNIPNNIPLFLAYGGADALSVTRDVKLLLESLRDHEGNKLVVEYRGDYAHGDYVMGVNAREVVYEPMMLFFGLQ